MMRLAMLPVVGMATRMPDWLREKIARAEQLPEGALEACDSPACSAPAQEYSTKIPIPAGSQWNLDGGYCGAWSMGRAAMAKGAYLSQQQVRDHAEYGGGHDNEILNTNIDVAARNLKLKLANFEFNIEPTPQADSYLQFMKKHIVAGDVVIWMVMFQGTSHPEAGYDYDNTTNGLYNHIEPVFGISSDHPLTDETVYDDDTFAYYDDAGRTTYYAKATEVPGTCTFSASGKTCRTTCPASGYNSQCLWEERGYVYAIEGFLDDRAAAPLTLSINPSYSESYTAEEITGTVTASGLSSGSKYEIHRWNSAEEAFAYSDASVIETFTATGDTYVFEDPKKFLSSSATYYRCVPAGGAELVI